MKLFSNISAIFLLIFIFSIPSFAQNDSVKVEYTEENPEKSDFNIKEKYKYLRKNMVEEKGPVPSPSASAIAWSGCRSTTI